MSFDCADLMKSVLRPKPSVVEGNLFNPSLIIYLHEKKIEKYCSENPSEAYKTTGNLLSLDAPETHGICRGYFNLNSVSLREAVKKINKIQHDCVLFLKTIHDCIRVVATETVVEDMLGDVVSLNIYNYVLPEEDPRKIFPRGTFLALCQPYLRFPRNNPNNPPVLRTDNPQTVILFDNENEWLLAQKSFSVQKSSKIKEEQTLIEPSFIPNEIISNEMCDEGNKYFKTNHLTLALKWYTKGLQNFPTNIRILCNRAAVNIGLERWSEVIVDTNIVLSLSPNHLKARFRKAYAMLCLNNPRDALDILKPLTSELTNNDSINLLVKNAELAIKELEGFYDIKAMIKEAENQNLKATSRNNVNHFFSSTIHMNFQSSDLEIKITPNKGRSVFATKTINWNQLVLVEKAIVNCIDNDGVQGIQIFNSHKSNRVSSSTMLPYLVQKIIRNSNICDQVYRLSDGFSELHLQESFFSTDNIDKDKVDVVRLRGIIDTNAFDTCTSGKIYDYSKKRKIQMKCSGLFYFSSYFNHSCTSNCDWFTIGQYLFIITNRNIEAGEELTIPYTENDGEFENVQQIFKNWNNYGGFTCYCARCNYLRDNTDILNACTLVDNAYSKAYFLFSTEKIDMFNASNQVMTPNQRSELFQIFDKSPKETKVSLCKLLELRVYSLNQESESDRLEKKFLLKKLIDLYSNIYGISLNSLNLLKYKTQLLSCLLYDWLHSNCDIEILLEIEALSTDIADLFFFDRWSVYEEENFLKLIKKFSLYIDPKYINEIIKKCITKKKR
ncbi:uncharacterized protein LOC136090690 [Hydra vulgaris]|uniref:Uncharacterized protein LOC136090690 n=1 Tax=Hydra vulgaris TaxID=6087 RepID=A0ABM4DGN6_HYDVU